jgi:MFS family permease
VTFVLLAAALLGASRAVYSGTLDAWLYDAFHQVEGKQTYHSALAKINVAVTIGLAVGSLIGGWLPDIASNSANVFSSIYDINLLGVCIANIGLIVITLMLIDDRRQRWNTQPKQARENAFQLCTQALKVCWKHDVLSRLMQATVVFGMVLSSVENYWQPYLADILRGTSSGVIAFGVISALYFIMSAVSSLISVPLLRVFSGSHKTLMFTTRALAGVCFIFLAYTAHLLSFTLCYLLFFFLLTVGNNSESVLLHENTEEKMRSTMLSISSFMVTCGGVFASLVFGVIAERFGISARWIISGALLVFSSVVFIFVSEKRELRVR